MKIALGTLACTGIEARWGSDFASGVEAALRRYTRQIESERAPITLPRFCREQAPRLREVAFDLPVDPHTEAVLQRETARQEATVGQLVDHSVLIYLAELDRLDEELGPLDE